MDPVTLGLISMGVGGAVKTLGGLFDNTASRQADLMHQQAQLKLATLEENMRRTEGQQTQVLSSTKARMAGTGFAGNSASFTNYLTTMATEFSAQNKAAMQQGLKSVDLMNQAADLTGDVGFAKLFGAAGDIFGTASNMAALAKVGG